MLRHRADIRPLFFNAVYFALLVFAWQVQLWSAWTVPLFLALCVTAFQGAVQNHNAIHSPVFRAGWLNRVYQLVLTLIYGHPSSSFVPGHNLGHHRHTDTPRDAMRTSKARFRINALNLLLFVALVSRSVMKTDVSYALAMRKRHRSWFRQLMTELAVLVVVSAALLVLDWQRAIVLWFIPHLYAQWGITGMNLLQHDGCDIDSEFNHSRNFVSGAVNWWTFNNGYHTIHHMRPGLHWSLAAEAHAREVAPFNHDALDQRSMLAYVFRAYVLNKREHYTGRPVELPPDPPDEVWIPTPRETPGDLGAVTS